MQLPVSWRSSAKSCVTSPEKLAGERLRLGAFADEHTRVESIQQSSLINGGRDDDDVSSSKPSKDSSKQSVVTNVEIEQLQRLIQAVLPLVESQSPMINSIIHETDQPMPGDQ